MARVTLTSDSPPPALRARVEAAFGRHPVRVILSPFFHPKPRTAPPFEAAVFVDPSVSRDSPVVIPLHRGNHTHTLFGLPPLFVILFYAPAPVLIEQVFEKM